MRKTCFPADGVMHIPASPEIAAASRDDAEALLRRLDCSAAGLTAVEAAARLKRFGPNVIAREHRTGIFYELVGRARNPLNALLLTLAIVSYFLGDARAAAVITGMVILSITTAFVQEHRSNQAAAKLRALVKNTTSVRRDGAVDGQAAARDGYVEIPMEEIVPGDLVSLSAGDMIPADLRLLSAKDLFVDQSALTGEAMPVEKSLSPAVETGNNPFDLPNICFMGGNVVSGYATGNRRPHWWQQLFRATRRCCRWAARPDKLRKRNRPVHLVDDSLHCRPCANRIFD